MNNINYTTSNKNIILDNSITKIKQYANGNIDEFNSDEIEYNNKLPENHGSKWLEEDNNKLIKLLQKYDISKIATKLGRTEGSIKAKIKKIIMEEYLNGVSIESVSDKLNLIYKDVKSIIKIYLDKESDTEIRILEKENNLLKLRLENYRLKKEIQEYNNL